MFVAEIFSLHFLFGKNLERATRIVDQRGVKRIVGEPSGRSIFQVSLLFKSASGFALYPCFQLISVKQFGQDYFFVVNFRRYQTKSHTLVIRILKKKKKAFGLWVKSLVTHSNQIRAKNHVYLDQKCKGPIWIGRFQIYG
jgi:hypothetical protein